MEVLSFGLALMNYGPEKVQPPSLCGISFLDDKNEHWTSSRKVFLDEHLVI